MSSSVQRIPSEQSSQLPAQRKELSRKRERDSEEPAESEIESQNHGIGKQSKVTKANSKRFPCPFFLRNPATYGRENGCSSYSRRIETVIRVLDVHSSGVSYSDDLLSITSSASTGRSTKKPVTEKTRSLRPSRSSLESRGQTSIKRRRNYGD